MSRKELYDCVSGRVTHGTKPGPRPYLTSEEEQELGTYLKHCAKVGHSKTICDIIAIVQERKEEELKKRSEEHAKKAELIAKQKAQKEEEKARRAKSRAASAGRNRAGDNERNSQPPRTDTHSSSSDFNQSECCVLRHL